MRALFVSDVHLCDARGDVTERFLRFLADEASGGGALYVLGDLFDEWLGDDEAGACVEAVTERLAALARRGVAVAVMHGNHDFLLAERFRQRVGCALLDDEHLIDAGAGRMLLMHGDTLCTDDTSYLSYRALVRDPDWQARFLSQAMEQRRAQAKMVRDTSARAGAMKPEFIMDVNAQAVLGALDRHRARVLVHGHTHRPAVHPLNPASDSSEPRSRITLGAWDERGWYLEWNGEGLDVGSFALREWPD